VSKYVVTKVYNCGAAQTVVVDTPVKVGHEGFGACPLRHMEDYKVVSVVEIKDGRVPGKLEENAETLEKLGFGSDNLFSS
jgi:hypothetical protein